MKAEGVSPAEMARRLGANRSQVYRLLSGERGPSNGLAVRIREATGVAESDWASAAPGRPKGRRVLPARSAARVVHVPTVRPPA